MSDTAYSPEAILAAATNATDGTVSDAQLQAIIRAVRPMFERNTRMETIHALEYLRIREPEGVVPDEVASALASALWPAHEWEPVTAWWTTAEVRSNQIKQARQYLRHVTVPWERHVRHWVARDISTALFEASKDPQNVPYFWTACDIAISVARNGMPGKGDVNRPRRIHYDAYLRQLGILSPMVGCTCEASAWRRSGSTV